MKKNDILRLPIEDLSAEGEGIGKADSFPFFVKDALPGDLAEVRITKLQKTYGYARLLSVIEPSSDRVEARCPKARACGGCQLQELRYEAELKFKTKKVADALQRIGGFRVSGEPGGEGIYVPEALGMADPWRYRAKAQIPFGYDRDGKLVAGFYAGRTHDIIDMEDCLLAPEETAGTLRAVKAWMLEYGVPAYREDVHEGLVRHLLFRKGFATGEIMACLIVNGSGIPHADALLEKLRKVPGFKTLTVNENRARTNVILGRRTETLYGPGWIEDRIGDVRFRISPASFFQVNPVQTAVLYGKALEYAGLKGDETVWDLYCGIGTISLFLAQKARRVYGVEIVPDAVRDARENAALNGFQNASFFAGKAEEVLPAYYAEHPEEKADVIVVDPPRKGCDRALLDTVARMAPDRFVYVSCDPATLARDLRIMDGYGYRIAAVQPVDMFPNSRHVETVCCLYHQKKDFISVPYEPKNAEYLKKN